MIFNFNLSSSHQPNLTCLPSFQKLNKNAIQRNGAARFQVVLHLLLLIVDGYYFVILYTISSGGGYVMISINLKL